MAGAMKRGRRINMFLPGNSKGFSLIEIISVLLILGILSAILIGRYMSTSSFDSQSQASVIKNNIRYAQSRAIKLGDPTNPATVWGIKSEGNEYWLFPGPDPDDPANLNRAFLPTENTKKVNLATRKVVLSAFTVFFDYRGKPYTAYTSDTTNTPVSAGNPLVITVTPASGGTAINFTITPETGFIE